MQRNKNHEYLLASECVHFTSQDKLMLPFILISAPKTCVINCEMLEDRTQYFFEFNLGFSIHEDMEILKLLGLNKITKDELGKLIKSPKITNFYPESLII